MILREAALNNQVDTVLILLDEKNLDTSTKIAGVPALFWAETSGNSEIIQLLIENRERNSTTDTSDDTGYNDVWRIRKSLILEIKQ